MWGEADDAIRQIDPLMVKFAGPDRRPGTASSIPRRTRMPTSSASEQTLTIYEELKVEERTWSAPRKFGDARA